MPLLLQDLESPLPESRVLPQSAHCKPISSQQPLSIPSLSPPLSPSDSTQDASAAIDAVAQPVLEMPVASTSSRSQRRESTQPSAADLAVHGVKVRDFAYESVRPPIRFTRWVPRQILPGLAVNLKRNREDDSQPTDDPFASESVPSGSRVPLTKRARIRPSEDTTSSQNAHTTYRTLLMRAQALMDIDEYNSDSQPLYHYSQPSINTRLEHESQLADDPDAYVHTPLVTPQGSLQWVGQDQQPQSPISAPDILPDSLPSLHADRTEHGRVPPNREVLPSTSGSLLPIRPSGPFPVGGPSGNRLSQRTLTPLTPLPSSDTSSRTHTPLPTPRYLLRKRPIKGATPSTALLSRTVRKKKSATPKSRPPKSLQLRPKSRRLRVKQVEPLCEGASGSRTSSHDS